ncbi:WD40-repeat-containing domain protein [Aspergillus pseudocaelatus]|uniref:WD40-repeat-containing domain protein n=1 Tax=Aspergillus pseudocaelatus TaxID=1825620 RepID=A0ABQ6WAK6_9EURO|nr:WD40-repeat-containing domain protein [Aspergillus pseudocaelatus]
MTANGDTNSAPICVASTQRGDEAGDAPLDSHSHGALSTACCADESASDTNYIKSVEWPPDLLEERPSPHRLSPYSVLASAEPTYATAIYPYYSLQDPSTTLFLSSVRDHPIRLASTLAPTLLATYSLIHPTTEAFITPHSIIYPYALGGTHFLTGSDSLICLFDVSRPGNDGPVSWMPTIPSKRKQTVGGGVGMKGIISAMAINPTGDGILAAGTFSRQVGLYDSNGTGQSLGTFSIAKTDASRRIGGRGITQILWSPCGRYLYIAERKSDGVMIYDIRVTGQLLGWLEGRKAITNQRMKVDIVSTNQGISHEIWAGGTDGFMRVWRDPTHTAGGQEPVWEWKIHDDSVSSTVLHPMGNVVATCSGQRHYLDDDDDDDDYSYPTEKLDNSMKVWSLPFLEDC